MGFWNNCSGGVMSASFMYRGLSFKDLICYVKQSQLLVVEYISQILIKLFNTVSEIDVIESYVYYLIRSVLVF